MVTFQEAHYLPVFLNTIRSNYIYGFDIYLKLQGKFVLYHAGGENFSQDKIENLIKNRVGIIYISSKDQVSYHQYITDNLTVIITNKKVPIEERSRIVHFSIRSIAREFFSRPDSQSLDYLKKSITKLTDFILLSDEAIFCLVQYESYMTTL